MNFENSKLKVRLTLLEQCLGTKPGNDELLRDYIVSKSGDEVKMAEEMKAREEDVNTEDAIEKKMTFFDKQAGHPYIWDYMVKGFLKEAWKTVKGIKGSKCSEFKAYKQKIDNVIFLADEDRTIFFKDGNGKLVEGSAVTEKERSLRAQTMQGERVALARSESVPAGSTLTFTFIFLEPELEACVRECLDYGFYKGLGQWRNGGYGRFKWQEVKD